MKSAWMLGAASAVLFSIGGCQGTKPELNEDFTDLAGADQKSDQFSKKLSIVGSLKYGDTSASVKYHNPAKYRAFTFTGGNGDQVTIDVTSKNGDSVAWLTNSAFKTLATNDDSNGGTNSHIAATLSAAGTYNIIFTEYYSDDATFKVALKGTVPTPPDYFSCKTTSDCVAESQGGCCPHGYKVAVNKKQVKAWETTQTCTTVPAPICPLYLVDDMRVASCNADSHECEMVAPTSTNGTCGGIAGITCPTGQTCVDNPNDSCDPNNGGADCGGICVTQTCVQRVLCVTTSHWDSTACACVPNAPAPCGGIAGLACPTGQTCVDNPSDSCDPAHGGRDCGGLCIDASTATHCGGFAARPCAAGQTCVDDPTDSCDPANGGADCGGLCVN